MRPIPQPAKAVCAARGIRNTELAAELGVTSHYVGRIFNGQVQPSQRLRERIAETLAVPAEDLFRPGGEAGSAGVLELLERTRTSRGLALVIDDPAIIAQVAAIVAAGPTGGEAA